MQSRQKWFGAASLAALAVGAFGGVGATAWAQEGPEVPQASEDADKIVVTARRREEAVLDVPIRTDVFGADEIDRLGITDMQSLEQAIVGAEFVADNGNPFNNEIIIRGGGVGRFTNVDGGTGLYFNGINIMGGNFGGRSLSGAEQFDVERYEVLKGPQGALYGRNALGGAINVISRQASTSDFGGEASVEAGSNGAYGIGGSVNIPLIEGKFAVRFAGRGFDQPEGFYFNPVLNEFIDARAEHNLRLQAVFQPSENWTWRAQIDNFEVEREGNLRYDGDIITNPFIWPTDDVNRGEQKVLNYNFSGTGDLGWATFDVVANRRHRNSEIFVDSDFGVSADPFNPATQNACFSTVVMMVASTGPNQRCTELQNGGFDMSSIEARLAGDTERLNWIVGVDAYEFEDLFEQTLRGRDVNSRYAFVNNETTSWSAFGGLEYQFTDRLSAGLELRQTHEDKVLDTFSIVLEGASAGTLQPLVDLDTTFDYNTWTAYAAYALGESWNAYGRVGTGFRSGGLNADSRDLLNTTTGLIAVVPDVYDAESATSYEAGLKGVWFGGLTVDAAVFFVEYEDFLSNKNNGITGVDRISFVDNVGNAELTGGELLFRQDLEDLFGPVDLIWSAGAAYLTGEIVEAENPADQGRTVSRVPEWSMTGSLTLETPLMAGAEGAVTVSYSGQRGGFQTFTNTVELPESDILNLQASLNYEQWRLGLNVTNLTDSEDLIGNPTPQAEARARDPRAYIIRLSRTFGDY